ncbi:hypothetical protein TURU_069910 [Turdus rufiventris]|nr:hypothetical protein TURU_069910 [Turdus rufiventris]
MIAVNVPPEWKEEKESDKVLEDPRTKITTELKRKFSVEPEERGIPSEHERVRSRGTTLGSLEPPAMKGLKSQQL